MWWERDAGSRPLKFGGSYTTSVEVDPPDITLKFTRHGASLNTYRVIRRQMVELLEE